MKMSEEKKLYDTVKTIIENDIRPYIEADGGRIELDDIDDENIVYVRLAGACAGCPGAVMTLKGGVERVIKAKLPQIRSVELAM